MTACPKPNAFPFAERAWIHTETVRVRTAYFNDKPHGRREGRVEHGAPELVARRAECGDSSLGSE